jgi:hypothetical protein
MTRLRHRCAEISRLAERLGDDATPALERHAIMAQLRAAVAGVELGLADGAMLLPQTLRLTLPGAPGGVYPEQDGA